MKLDRITKFLNKRASVAIIQEHLGLEAIYFNGQYWLTKKMVADFYEVEERTIERYIAQNEEELNHNGYILSKGKLLKELKLQFAHVINVGSKTTQLGLFKFRAFLNIGMLLTESEKAKELRSLILDIVIATINERTGGGTKFINRRDVNYLPAAIQEDNYRKTLTSAISRYVIGHTTFKYAQVTDIIYKAAFRENAKEYKKILRLGDKDNVRQTLYAEVLLLISSFENGVGNAIYEKYKATGKMLSVADVEQIVQELEENPDVKITEGNCEYAASACNPVSRRTGDSAVCRHHDMMKPFLHDARTKMSSRDLSFRDAYHGNIAEYLRAVTPEEYERFIGEQSVDFDQILKENKDVLKRLKQVDDEQ